MALILLVSVLLGGSQAVSSLPGTPGAVETRSASQRARECRQITLSGEVAAGQNWSASIGEGWVFRLVPIPSTASASEAYTGWDLAVDRVSGAGYPDALLLATPPYGSLNEREIGTTFGMRAQDAIAWDKRRFRFLTSPDQLKRGQEAFRILMATQGSGRQARDAKAENQAVSELLSLAGGAAAGEFQVLDARLSLGSADPPGFARSWAERLSQVPHTVVQADQNGRVANSAPGSPDGGLRGELKWIRFTATLWLPANWNPPAGIKFAWAKCAQ